MHPNRDTWSKCTFATLRQLGFSTILLLKRLILTASTNKKKVETRITSDLPMRQKFHYDNVANTVDSSSATLMAWPITMSQVSFVHF